VLLQVDSLDPVSDLMKKVGCTLTSDGWSSTTNIPLLNVLAVTPMGAKFLKAVDTSCDVKSADYIAYMLCETVEELGPENVVQVVTDNASACLAAQQLVAER
jgi:hypothetical protein